MGFYHPSTLVKDALRHGVEIRPIDVDRSGWRCRWEDRVPASKGQRAGGAPPAGCRPSGALRLGLRFVRGLRRSSGAAIEAARAAGPFRSPEDLVRRAELRSDELEALAAVGGLASFGLTRRAALWQVARLARPAGPLLDQLSDAAPSPLPEMSSLEETLADYHGASITLGPHPIAYLRAGLKQRGVTAAADLPRLQHGARVTTAGSIIVRQRPGTAKGLLFMTLEDETGMCQAIITPDLLEEHRKLLVGATGLAVEGVLQKRDGSLSVKAERFWALDDLAKTPSHDFR